jgi:hypothetical protein
MFTRDKWHVARHHHGRFNTPPRCTADAGMERSSHSIRPFLVHDDLGSGEIALSPDLFCMRAKHNNDRPQLRIKSNAERALQQPFALEQRQLLRRPHA